MSQRTRVKIDAIRAVMRDCTADETNEILAVINKPVDDVAPVLIDQAAIERALTDTVGHVGRAADRLGCARRTLQKKMREYGMPVGVAGRKKRFA